MIRKMNIDDYEKVKELVAKVHTLHYENRSDIYNSDNILPLEYFKKVISDDEHLNYVYEENDKVIGMISVSIKRTNMISILKERTIYYIDDIVVDQNDRNKGIGKSLYFYIEKLARKNNVDAIELNVWPFNESAIAFYDKVGMSVKNIKLEKLLYDDLNIETKNIDIAVTKKVNS